MNGKRKDNRGRVLKTGETQEPCGRYVFSYIDRQKKQKHKYSWKLEEYDPIPQGKRDCLALRTIEKKIKRALDDELVIRNMTVIDLVEEYIATKAGYVRYSTEVNYRYVRNILKQEDFGYRLIDTVKMPMAKEFLRELQCQGRGYSTIQSVRGVLRPAFRRAFENEWIKRNPFDFPLAGVVLNDSTKRAAISADQQRKFLGFIREDKHFCKYYDAINILFKTGLRISEWCGLTLSDIDFTEQTLTVCRQLQRKSDMSFIIEETKTANGVRTLPLVDDVCDSFRRIVESRRTPTKEPTVDGISGFLFLDKNGLPMVAYHWEKYFQHICAKYNKTYKEELPPITPHVCRHTYCTNMVKAGINPVFVSYLMGHSDKEITMNIYTTVNASNSSEDIRKAVTASAKNPYFQSVLN